MSDKDESRAAVNRYTSGDHLVMRAIANVQFECVGRVRVKGSVLWMVRVPGLTELLPGESDARPANPSPTVTSPAIVPEPPSPPAFTCTGPAPVPEPLCVLLITSLPPLMMVPPE